MLEGLSADFHALVIDEIKISLS